MLSQLLVGQKYLSHTLLVGIKSGGVVHFLAFLTQGIMTSLYTHAFTRLLFQL